MYNTRGRLSIIMPAYNEEALIYKNVIKTLEIVEKFAPNLEVIVVNDGSEDNTESEVIKAMKKDSRVRLISSKKNHGKGAAIITGVAEATGDYIAFVDADLELNPSQLEGYLCELIEKDNDVVIGCKLHKDSKLKYPFVRRIISMGYYIMLRVLFRLNVKDTQTGLKVFKAEAIRPVAHLIRTSGFAYDVELLVALNRRGKKIAQMPVEVVFVREKNSRRIGFKDIWKAFLDTWKIFGRVYFKHYYD